MFLEKRRLKLGIANAAEVDKEALDSLVNKRSSQISSNSQEAVKAFKDLYGLSQSGLSIDDALKAELENEFPEINDTNERLADFK